MIAARRPRTKEPRIVKDEGHLVLSGVSWEAFETISDALGPRHLRIAYDDGELELMTTSFEHEGFGQWIGHLLLIFAVEFDILLCSGGSTTLKKSLVEKGIEPDQCFWIGNEEAMRGKKQWNAETDPPPDLAIEIDISRSSLNRLGIYAALGVPEVWTFDGESLAVRILGSDGEFKERAKSKSFPTLNIKKFATFVKRLGSDAETRLYKEFREWTRSELEGPKKQRKHTNGK